MVAIAWHKSSTGILPWPLGAITGCPFWAADCWDRSWSRLLLSVSLRSALRPNLLKTFLELLLLPWLRRVIPVLAFTPLEVNVWERLTSISGFTPVCWVLTAIGFPPISYVCSTCGFLPLCWSLGAFGFSPDCCVAEAYRALVTLFLLVLTETEPWGERYALYWCLPFVYRDLWASHLFNGLSRVSSFWGAWEFTHCVKCIRAASIHSMVALIESPR